MLCKFHFNVSLLLLMFVYSLSFSPEIFISNYLVKEVMPKTYYAVRRLSLHDKCIVLVSFCSDYG